jgi:HD-GYP domain-containing protein (c-di-GMP phosphodiesterase class II)
MDPNEQQQFDQQGEEFLKAFHSLLQTVKIHQDTNQMLLRCVDTFVKAVLALCVEDDDLTVQIVKGRFFLQAEKLTHRIENAAMFDRMLEYFEKRGLIGLRFSAELKDIPAKDCMAFARMVNRAERQQAPAQWLDDQLEENEYYWVEITEEPVIGLEEETSPIYAGDTEIDPQDRKEQARRTYSGALHAVKDVARKVLRQKRAGARTSIRMVQNMVKDIMDDEDVFLTLSTIRIYDDYTYGHSVNVAILAMCLGNRIGLSRKSIERLGLCGLFHDLGKVEIPKEIINKPGKLDAAEMEEVQRHSIYSVRLIAKLRAPRDRKAKIILPPFEHHLKYDLSGYPQMETKKPVSLFGRILTIVDVYDSITSPRIYRPTSMSPDRALGYMLEKAGLDFDPILLKVFVNMLGAYPVGTLLQLDTNEIGLVMSGADGGDPKRPAVQLLVSDGQGGYIKGQIVKLNERDAETGAYQRNIVKSLHPGAMGIQPAVFLF